MLAQLFIQNIAVIERASIDLDRGFTVLTGETGAGKSIIIDAIHAVLGERTSKELVRTGTDAASVSALFTGLEPDVVQMLEALSVPAEEDNSLLIQRDIRLTGRSACKMNGAPATVSMLKQVAPRLISIHGQHESYELLSPEVHMDYIDSFARVEKLREEYQESYHRLRKLQRELEDLDTDEGEKARQLDLLRYQVEEIEAAQVQPGEQERLAQEREAIRNSEKIASSVELSKALLAGDEERGGILADLAQAASEMEKAAAFLPEAGEAAQKLREASYLLEDADSALHGLSVDFDPSALDAIEERLDVLYRLGMKYGGSEEKILEYLADCQEKLHAIEFSDEERARLEGEYEKEKGRAIALAKELSQKRKDASGKFMAAVKKELAFLNMPGIEFVTEIQRVPLHTGGCDKLQFLVSANKGEPAKPLSKIASGGELSRIMLAVNRVGEKLKQVSHNRQVLCITHLAQIAAMADNHLFISKHTEKNRTFTKVEPLDLEGRKQELARIISGEDVTDLQLKMAEEMLQKP